MILNRTIFESQSSLNSPGLKKLFHAFPKANWYKDAAIVVHKKSTEFTYGTEIDVTKNIDECINEILSFLSNP